MTTYKPTPINTDHIQLDPDQRALVEALSANAHEIWARKRLSDGWVLGPRRDDEKKHHPCLVPYAELPESEKDYDREIVEQTIKAALSIGYRVSKASTS